MDRDRTPESIFAAAEAVAREAEAEALARAPSRADTLFPRLMALAAQAGTLKGSYQVLWTLYQEAQAELRQARGELEAADHQADRFAALLAGGDPEVTGN